LLGWSGPLFGYGTSWLLPNPIFVLLCSRRDVLHTGSDLLCPRCHDTGAASRHCGASGTVGQHEFRKLFACHVAEC
jgi:hypothetical protein